MAANERAISRPEAAAGEAAHVLRIIQFTTVTFPPIDLARLHLRDAAWERSSRRRPEVQHGDAGGLRERLHEQAAVARLGRRLDAEQGRSPAGPGEIADDRRRVEVVEDVAGVGLG